MPRPAPPSEIRPAKLSDLDALVAIQAACYETDLLTRRSLRYLLTKANAICLLEVQGGSVRGFAIALLTSGTSMARLYAFAVQPENQRRGIGSALLDRLEQAVEDRDCVVMRVEIRRDDAYAIDMFKRRGYRQFDTFEDYYEDHMTALRFEKSLAPHLNPDLVRVPHIQQSLDFTCGPAAVMMGMKALAPDMIIDRKLELRIWRESTTVFMTSGHGGCGPYGLGLAAHHRGFGVEIYVKDAKALFVDSVRSDEKKEVIRLVQEDFMDEIRASDIKVHYGTLNVAEMQRQFEAGGIPIVLISSYRIYHEKFPHWVVVTGFDERFIYVHDPLVDTEAGETLSDSINMPILKKDFERMARYGKAGQRAALILRKNGASAVTPRVKSTNSKKGKGKG